MRCEETLALPQTSRCSRRGDLAIDALAVASSVFGVSQGFRNLTCWQRAKELSVAIYRLTDRPPLKRDFALRDQMRRAAISVCSNLAEGDSRQTNKESIQFFFVAKGSLAELSAQLDVAGEIHGLPSAETTSLTREGEEIAAMIRGLIITAAPDSVCPQTPHLIPHTSVPPSFSIGMEP